jgi:RHS repeat-associated protein
VTATVSPAQTLTAGYRYDPFGRTLGSVGAQASANPMRFSSKPMLVDRSSESLSLYYYGYRFYDAQIQRWLNRDPSGESDGLNVYRYSRHSPLTRIDPFGLRGVTMCFYHIDSTITDNTKREVARMLYDFLSTCIPCDSTTGTPKHKVFTNWIPRTPDDPSEDLGFWESGPIGVSNFSPSGYGVLLRNHPSQAVVGNTRGNTVFLNEDSISIQAANLGLPFDMVMAMLIAHEVFHHAIGGSWLHFYSDPYQYVDGSPGATGGVLSPGACKELCDELDVDE